MAGRVGWRPGASGRRGMDLRSKKISDVNIVTYNIQPPTQDIQLYVGMYLESRCILFLLLTSSCKNEKSYMLALKTTSVLHMMGVMLTCLN